MTFGEKLKDLRLKLNYSQSELSEVTGISERSLYTYEQLGAIPRKSNIKKLSEALKVDAEYLTDESLDDPGADFEEEEFVRRAKSRYGNKGKREAEAILARAGALFAGGALDDDAKDVFMESLMKIYMESKEEASKKFGKKEESK
jgi:transcriptional regulator with XRE-family HTH domain